MRDSRNRDQSSVRSGPDEASEPVRSSVPIVLASAALAAVLTLGGCSSAGRVSAAGSPSSAVNSYLDGFRTLNATETIESAAGDLRATMPSSPEQMLAGMRQRTDRYGRVQSWTVDSETIDRDNGQALLTVRSVSEKAIFVMVFDVRRDEGSWRVYGVKDLDRLKNPAYGRQVPSDIGRSDPFIIR